MACLARGPGNGDRHLGVWAKPDSTVPRSAHITPMSEALRLQRMRARNPAWYGSLSTHMASLSLVETCRSMGASLALRRNPNYTARALPDRETMKGERSMHARPHGPQHPYPSTPKY